MSITLTDDERAILKQFAGFLLSLKSGTTSSGETAPASDAELDSQYGDPNVRRDPKRWAGASYVGATFSQCPTEYLLVMAESLEYFANKNRNDPNAKKSPKGKPYWEYDLRDAARARGWAARNRGKDLPPPPPQPVVDPNFDGGSDQPSGGDSNDNWAP